MDRPKCVKCGQFVSSASGWEFTGYYTEDVPNNSVGIRKTETRGVFMGDCCFSDSEIKDILDLPEFRPHEETCRFCGILRQDDSGASDDVSKPNWWHLDDGVGVYGSGCCVACLVSLEDCMFKTVEGADNSSWVLKDDDEEKTLNQRMFNL